MATLEPRLASVAERCVWVVRASVSWPHDAGHAPIAIAACHIATIDAWELRRLDQRHDRCMKLETNWPRTHGTS